MNSAQYRPFYRAKLPLPIIVALIAAIGAILVAAIHSGVVVYQTRHNNFHLIGGHTHELEFMAASSERRGTFDLTPHTGTVVFSLSQKIGQTGNVNTYEVRHKRSTESTFRHSKTITVGRNNEWTPFAHLREVNRFNTYNVVIRKTTGYQVRSVILFDWCLENPDFAIQ